MSNCFVAIVPAGANENQTLKQLLGKMKRTLSDREIEARWTPPDLWHVTLQFMGPLPEDGRARFLESIKGWKADVHDLTIRLQGVGGFPLAESARVLWLGVQENQEFHRVQADLGKYLAAEGFTVSDREFHPHLTICRLRNPHGIGDLVQLGGRKHFGDYPVAELVVFQSVLQGNILKYVPLLRLPL